MSPTPMVGVKFPLFRDQIHLAIRAVHALELFERESPSQTSLPTSWINIKDPAGRDTAGLGERPLAAKAWRLERPSPRRYIVLAEPGLIRERSWLSSWRD